MYVKYGNFEFYPWEAGLSVRADFQRSAQSQKHIQRVVYDISIDVNENGQYNTNDRLDEIIAAFSQDGYDVGLFHDNGDPTKHFLPSAIPQNLTGNMVYFQQFPDTVGGEFATGREMKLSVGAYLLDYQNEILEYQDALIRNGNAGPLYRWRRNRFWGFYPELVSPSTQQIIRHVGYSVGATGYPLPVTPFYTPPFEANHLRRVVQHSPQRFAQGATGYKTSWEYTYTLPTFDDTSVPT